MGIMPPRGPVSNGLATAVAKSVKKGYVDESRMPTRDQIAERDIKRAEEPLRKTGSLVQKPENLSLLARIRKYILPLRT